MMNMKENDSPEQRPDMCRVYKLHIKYIIFICVLICLFVILVAPNYVSDEAFRNFSFAATITSIVLAVVSIVYSFYSSGGLTMSIGEMKQVEQELEDEIRNIPDLKNHVSQTVDDLRENILKAIAESKQASDSKTEELIESVHEKGKYWTNSEKVNPEKKDVDNNKKGEYFNYTSNSILGNLFVYALFKSWTTKQPFNISSVSQLISPNGLDYLKGYLVALAMCSPNFQYSNDEDFTTITVKAMDSSYFGLETIDKQIMDSRDKEEIKEKYKNKMKLIDGFFDPNKLAVSTTEAPESKG